MPLTPDDLRSHLDRTPGPLPPDALWSRLAGCRRRQLRRRRLLAGATSTGLALALAVALWPLSQAPDTASSPALVATASIDVDADVLALDRALQAAYNRGASDAEIAPMWEARDALLARAAPRGGNAGNGT